jgi:glutamyl-tRNA synthetase
MHADSPTPKPTTASFRSLTPIPLAPTTRLAPSPTGALHLGNARTFLITWALARQLGWRIILRIEDLDTPRVKPATIDDTLRTLEWLGIDWDTGPLIQSADLPHHAAAMAALAAQRLVYPSRESRSEIDDAAASLAASAPQEGAHDVAFPAALRTPPESRPRSFERLPEGHEASANWRLVVEPGSTPVDDLFAGHQSFDVASIVGDFVVWTKRGTPSYQLAVVVDDHRQGITHVVRGDDLLDSAARQTLLYRALRLGPPPRYLHLPLVLGTDGRRLAKRHGDTRVAAYSRRGVSPERMLGLLAFWSGISPRRSPISAAEFRDRLRLDTIPRRPVTFTAEDDAWLLE